MNLFIKAFQCLFQAMAIQLLWEDLIIITDREPPGYLPVREAPGHSKAVNCLAPELWVRMSGKAVPYHYQPMAVRP